MSAADFRPRAERIFRARCRAGTAVAVAVLASIGGPAAHSRDLSLEQAIALAHERSPTIAIERQRLAESEADYRSARAGLLPRLSLSAFHNRLNDDRLSPAGSTTGAITLFSRETFAGVLARQLLYDGGRVHSLEAAAARGIDAQQAGASTAREEIALQVTQAYYRVLEADALRRVAEEALRRQDEFVQLTEVLFKAGRATRLDGLRAEAQREEARRTLERAREAGQLALVVLRRTMAVPVTEPIGLTDALPLAIAEPRADEALSALALERNVDLKRIAHQIDQAGENREAARAARWPELSLQGSYGHRDRNVGGSALEWTVGVFAAWTLYDGGGLGGQVDKAQARLAQLEESRRGLVVALEADVRDAASTWRTARADAAAAERLLEANRESLKAALTLYQAGKATALDVLTAQADVVRAEGSHAQARAAHAIARARLARLTGASSFADLERSP